MMTLLKKMIIILIVTFTFSNCTSNNDLTEIIINEESYGEYPAVILDLESGTIFKVKRGDKTFDADLWIEPNDPEIGCLKGKGKRKAMETLNKENVYLRFMEEGETAMDIKALFPDKFKVELSRSEIKPGKTFIVRSRHHIFYKVNILTSHKNEMTLIYQKI